MPLPRLLRRLVSRVSIRDRDDLRSQLHHIRAQIGACSESLDNSDGQAWVTQARELAYDMDDWILLFEFDRFRCHNYIAHKLRDLKARFNALNEGRPRSILDAPQPIDDPRPTKLHLVNTEGLVGHDAAMDEVASMVTDGGDKPDRKIVSIVGMAGSGKTTLAATVYQRLGEQNGFQCRAFVSVGRKPDLRRILKKMLSQHGGGHRGSEEIDQLVQGLSDLLKEKRYLILVDDLWRWEHWETIKDCFPENNLSSRIIITTRDDALASKCSSGSRDYVYKISLLSDADSRKLFLKQVGDACPQYWDDVCDQIMTSCGGLPIALVRVAAMLAHKPSRDEWESSHMDWMKPILSLRYNALPLHLKPCLLYLSIFPENYKVEVKRLMRLWIAEGLLTVYRFSVTEESPEKYLDELNRRNMVELLHTKNNYGGSSRYCKLHPVIRDFIACKSKEENFVTLVDAQHQHVPPIHQKTIRRLSIQSSDKQDDEALARNVTMNLSCARSVTVFGQASATPRLTDLPVFVRVLDLEGCNGPVCLDGLLNLRFLRYLNLSGTDVSQLPAKIGALLFLRYLILRGTDVKELPDTIGRLWRLHILDVRSTKGTPLPGSIDSIATRTRIPESIVRCRFIEKLVTVDLSDHLPSFVESLGFLRFLKVIAITWSFHQCTDEAYGKALLSSIRAWQELTSLTIHCGLGCSMEFLGSLSRPPMKLQKFKVTAGRFASVPKWISKLNNLSVVQITIFKQGTEQLKILGDFPKLRRLILGLDFITENPIVIESGWFPSLERFSVDCPRPWLSFSEGSMKRLTYLELKLCACPVKEGEISVPSGIGNLRSIEEVSLCYNPKEEHSPNISMIVEAMRKAVSDTKENSAKAAKEEADSAAGTGIEIEVRTSMIGRRNRKPVTRHANRIDLFINGTKDYSAEAAEEEADSAAGTGIGTAAGNKDIQRVSVNATKGIQRTTEIEEMESEA